jgi:hypothetical protein
VQAVERDDDGTPHFGFRISDFGLHSRESMLIADRRADQTPNAHIAARRKNGLARA